MARALASVSSRLTQVLAVGPAERVREPAAGGGGQGGEAALRQHPRAPGVPGVRDDEGGAAGGAGRGRRCPCAAVPLRGLGPPRAEFGPQAAPSTGSRCTKPRCGGCRPASGCNCGTRPPRWRRCCAARAGRCVLRRSVLNSTRSAARSSNACCSSRNFAQRFTPRPWNPGPNHDQPISSRRSGSDRLAVAHAAGQGVALECRRW